MKIWFQNNFLPVFDENGHMEYINIVAEIYAFAEFALLGFHVFKYFF